MKERAAARTYKSAAKWQADYWDQSPVTHWRTSHAQWFTPRRVCQSCFLWKSEVAEGRGS